MKIIVQLDQNSRRLDRGDGAIYFDCGSFQFPEKNWFDFTFMVVTEWNGSIYLMLEGKEDSCMLTFMDGRWAVRLTRKAEECVLEFGIYDVYDKVFEHSGQPNVTLDFKEFYDELMKANIEIGEYVKQYSIASDNYKWMESWYQKLLAMPIS